MPNLHPLLTTDGQEGPAAQAVAAAKIFVACTGMIHFQRGHRTSTVDIKTATILNVVVFFFAPLHANDFDVP